MKKFNYQELIKKYLLNKRLAKRENDPNKKSEYENSANWSRYILDLTIPHFRMPLEHTEVLEADRCFLRCFGEYAPMVKEFAKNIDIPDTLEVELSSENSVGKLMMNVRQFYSDINKEYYQNVYSVMADGNSYMRIKKSRHESCVNEVIPLENQKSFFMDVTLDGSTNDFLTFVHMFSHANSILINNDHDFYSKKCLYEADSLFLELVALDKLSNAYSNNTTAISIKMFNEFVRYAEIARAKMDLSTNFNESALKDKPKVVTYLESCGFDSKRIDEILRVDIDTYFTQTTGYMTAIELYFKYQEDEKVAFDLLDKIIKMKDLTAREYLEELNKMGIVLGEHVLEYRSTLVDRYNHGKRL